MNKYNLIQLIKAYNDNKHIIDAHIKNKSIEGYSRDTINVANKNDTAILGMAIEVFLVFFIISLIIWVWALILLVQNWNSIPVWAKVVGVIGVLPVIPGGSIITIVSVLLSKQSR